jgi:hypothetical protein
MAPPCALTSLLLDVGQLQTVFGLKYTIMTRKHLACHDKLANIAFGEQSEEFDFAQPRSVQTVKFDYFSPISFVSQIHILSRKGHIGKVYRGHGELMPGRMFNASAYLYSPAGAYSA